MDTYSVLIVDDEKNIRLALSEALVDMDIRVESTSTGEEALTALEREAFSLVLLDLKMPGLDGMEVLRRIRQSHPNVDVVIITAHGTVDAAVEAMKLGAVDFLRKPFTPAEVRRLVARMIARERSEEARAGSYDALINAARDAIAHHKPEIGDRNARSALRIDASRPEAHNLLGVLREIAGDRFEAQQCYRKALETDPGYAPALANLRESVEPDRKTSFFLDEAKIVRDSPRQ